MTLLALAEQQLETHRQFCLDHAAEMTEGDRERYAQMERRMIDTVEWLRSQPEEGVA